MCRTNKGEVDMGNDQMLFVAICFWGFVSVIVLTVILDRLAELKKDMADLRKAQPPTKKES